jgi:hypothetical protein
MRSFKNVPQKILIFSLVWYMIDYWRGDVVDCMRHEEEKIPGMNTTYTEEADPFYQGGC